jgi:plastocyanin
VTKPLSIAALAALTWVVPSPATPWVIRGTLRVPPSPPPASAMNAYPGSAASLPGMHAPRRGLAGDAVVYVSEVPARAESALAAAQRPAPQLAQKDQSFVPRVIAIAVGTTIDFPNQDPIYHNVFSLSPARRFDLGKYPRGASRPVTFPKPGLVNVYCDIHSNMEAFVLVLPHHAFAQPTAAGEFALPDLPAGTYVLNAWHPDLGTRSATVEVPETGTVVVDLGY